MQSLTGPWPSLSLSLLGYESNSAPHLIRPLGMISVVMDVTGHGFAAEGSSHCTCLMLSEDPVKTIAEGYRLGVGSSKGQAILAL